MHVSTGKDRKQPFRTALLACLLTVTLTFSAVAPAAAMTGLRAGPAPDPPQVQKFPCDLGCSNLPLPSDGVAVIIDGDGVQWLAGYPAPFLDPGGRILVPLRPVFLKLGVPAAAIRWDPDTKTVSVQHDDHVLRVTVGDQVAEVDGVPYRLDVPAQIVADRTFLPLRLVAEALGAAVSWDGHAAHIASDLAGEFSDEQVQAAYEASAPFIRDCVLSLVPGDQVCARARKRPLPFGQVTPQLFREAVLQAVVHAKDEGSACITTDTMVDTIARIRGVPHAQVMARLSPDEICFLSLYVEAAEQAIQTATDWEPWAQPMAYVRFVLLVEKLHRPDPSAPPDEDALTAVVMMNLGFVANLKDLGDIGEGNLDVLAQKMGWRQTATLPDGKVIDATWYNQLRRRPFGSRINGPDRVFFRVDYRGYLMEVIAPESRATWKESMGLGRFSPNGGRTFDQMITWLRSSSQASVRTLAIRIEEAVRKGIPVSQPWVASSRLGRVTAELARALQRAGGAAFVGRSLAQLFGRLATRPMTER